MKYEMIIFFSLLFFFFYSLSGFLCYIYIKKNITEQQDQEENSNGFLPGGRHVVLFFIAAT